MWNRIYGDWSQIPAKRINTKPTAWLQTPVKRHRSHNRQNLISFFPHRTNVQSGVTDTGYYITRQQTYYELF
jgi:hypothetical protein